MQVIAMNLFLWDVNLCMHKLDNFHRNMTFYCVRVHSILCNLLGYFQNCAYGDFPSLGGLCNCNLQSSHILHGLHTNRNHRNKEKNICLGRSEQVHGKICSDFPIKSFSSLFHMYYWDFCLLLGGRKTYIHLSFKKNEIVLCRTFIKHDSLFVRKNIM